MDTDHVYSVDVFYDIEHLIFAVYLDAMICDCHELVWHDKDIRSDDGRSLSCPLVPVTE